MFCKNNVYLITFYIFQLRKTYNANHYDGSIKCKKAGYEYSATNIKHKALIISQLYKTRNFVMKYRVLKPSKSLFDKIFNKCYLEVCYFNFKILGF